jgi:hypothetical protein
VTQLAFPEATTQLVYATVAPSNTKGQNSITNATDNVFSDARSVRDAGTWDIRESACGGV